MTDRHTAQPETRLRSTPRRPDPRLPKAPAAGWKTRSPTQPPRLLQGHEERGKFHPPTAPVTATPCPFSTWPLPHRTTIPPPLAGACRQRRPSSRRAATAARKTRAGYDPNADPGWKIAGRSVPPSKSTPGLTPAFPGRTPAVQCRKAVAPDAPVGVGTADGGGGGIRGFHPHPRAALRASRLHSTMVERHTPVARLIGPRYFRTVPSW